MVSKRIIIITQARVGSTRFPEKVLKPLGNGTMLSIHLERLQLSKYKEKVIVATTFEEKSDQILEIAEKGKAFFFQGSTTDVLDRFYQAAKIHYPDYVVRVTSDCPLIDPALIDNVIKMVIDQDLDYGANILEEEFPDGQDVEVFTYKALERAWEEADLISDREHVTPYIRRNSTYKGGKLFKSNNFASRQNLNHVRMTVDELSDLETIQILLDKLGKDRDYLTYAQYILSNSRFLSNQKILRNEGYINSIKND